MALRAFPRRFRAGRTAEIISTFEEAELAGQAHPYGTRAIVDVVTAGWAERLRTHPSLGPYVKYRLFDGRLAPQWHRWMLDDVRGWFGLRRAVSMAFVFAAVFSVFHLAGMPPPDRGFLAVCVVMVAVNSVVATPYHRRRILRRHGYVPDTLTWAPPSVWAATAPKPPRLVRVAPVAFTMAAALTVVAPFAVLASLGRIGNGSGNVTRGADGQLPATIAAVAVATLLVAAGIIWPRPISRRFTRMIPDGATADFVFSDLASAGTLSTAVAAIGLIACFTPITPLIVPLAFIVSAGAVPTAVLAGIQATRHRPDGSIIVWTARPSHAGTTTTT
jgi:uncharacterized membrane protein